MPVSREEMCIRDRDTAAQKATVTREHENGYEIVEVPLPVLVTATAELNEPRQPGLWSSIYAKRYEISHITSVSYTHLDVYKRQSLFRFYSY